MGRRVVGVVALSLAYATLRYNVAKDVPWAQWPTYVVNKAAALSALGLLVLAVASRDRSGDRARLLAAVGWLVPLHVALSLLLAGPASYPALFEDGLPTAAAGASLLLGALAAALAPRLLRSATDVLPPAWGLRAGALAFLSGTHAALLGYGNWVRPSTWPAGLPPITLLAFLTGVAGLAAGLLRRRRGGPGAP